MSKLDKILEYLGVPYQIKTVDQEPVVYRKLNDFEFEISGLYKSDLNCTLYVWRTDPHRDLVGIYSDIRNLDDLKDLLGYCSVKYQNVLSRIRVEREGQTE